MPFNTPTYKYVDSTVLINNVKNKLSSYFEQGLVDESLLYPVIKSCLDRMGFKIYPVRSKIIEVKDMCADLPNDLEKVIYAIGARESIQYDLPDYTSIPQYTEKLKVTVDKGETPQPMTISCSGSKVTFCPNEFGDLYEFSQEFDAYKITYSNLIEVKVVGKSIHQPSLGSSTPYFVSVEGGNIRTNFNGTIYIEYLSSLFTEDGEFSIPDYTQITNWIEHCMMLACLEKLYLNGEGDLLQRLQYITQQTAQHEQVARSFFKSIEVQDLMDLSKILKSRYQKYRSAIRGPLNRNPGFSYDSSARQLKDFRYNSNY